MPSTRRCLLRSLGGAAVTGLAGCAGDLGPGSPRSPSQTAGEPTASSTPTTTGSAGGSPSLDADRVRPAAFPQRASVALVSVALRDWLRKAMVADHPVPRDDPTHEDVELAFEHVDAIRFQHETLAVRTVFDNGASYRARLVVTDEEPPAAEVTAFEDLSADARTLARRAIGGSVYVGPFESRPPGFSELTDVRYLRKNGTLYRLELAHGDWPETSGLAAEQTTVDAGDRVFDVTFVDLRPRTDAALDEAIETGESAALGAVHDPLSRVVREFDFVARRHLYDVEVRP